MRGVKDMIVSVGQHSLAMEQLRRQYERAKLGNREVRNVIKAHQHRAAALAGGGTREVARRARQIATGQLQVSV